MKRAPLQNGLTLSMTDLQQRIDIIVSDQQKVAASIDSQLLDLKTNVDFIIENDTSKETIGLLKEITKKMTAEADIERLRVAAFSMTMTSLSLMICFATMQQRTGLTIGLAIALLGLVVAFFKR